MRYRAEAAYRFNRHFRRDPLPQRLLGAAIGALPIQKRGAEGKQMNLANQLF